MAERGILIVAIGSALFGLMRPAGCGPYAGRIIQGAKAFGLARFKPGPDQAACNR
jgi:hypothetical protein